MPLTTTGLMFILTAEVQLPCIKRLEANDPQQKGKNMKRKLTVLGLIFLLSLSARASTIVADVHNQGSFQFSVNTDEFIVVGNNKVYYKVPYSFSNRGQGNALVFYDVIYSTIKIIGFGRNEFGFYNLVIEANWPNLNQSASGVASFQSTGLEAATLSIGSPTVQGLDAPAPARTERSGDGLFLPDHDLKSVIPDESGLQSVTYKHHLKGIFPDEPVLVYDFYVSDMYYDPTISFFWGDLTAELSYYGLPWTSTDGFIFVKLWLDGPNEYIALYITLFQTDTLKSRSLTDNIFFSSGANSMYMISPEGSFGLITLTLQ